MLAKTAMYTSHQGTVAFDDHMTLVGLLFLNLRKIIMIYVSILWIEQRKLLPVKGRLSSTCTFLLVVIGGLTILLLPSLGLTRETDGREGVKVLLLLAKETKP